MERDLVSESLQESGVDVAEGIGLLAREAESAEPPHRERSHPYGRTLARRRTRRDS